MTVDTLIEVHRQISELEHRKMMDPLLFWEPYDRQIPFLKAKQKTRCLFGGNQSGKTQWGSAETAYWLTGTHPHRETPPPPIRGRAVCTDFINGIEKIVIPAMKEKLGPRWLGVRGWDGAYSKEMRTLTLTNGSILEFMSSDQESEKHAGVPLDFVWYDEEPPRHIWTENLARLLKKNGDIWLTMTALNGGNWVYRDLYLMSQAEPNRIFSDVVPTEANPYISKEARENLAANLSEDERRARLLGEFVIFTGKHPIYSSFRRSLHVAPKHLDAIPGKPLHIGVDWGLTPAAVITQITTGGRWQVLYPLTFATEDRPMSARELAEALHIALADHYPGWPVQVWADPAGWQRSQADMKRCVNEFIDAGFRINRGEVSFVTRRLVMEKALNTLVDGLPRLVIDPRCGWLIDALAGGYHWREDSQGILKSGEDVEKRWGYGGEYSHVANALEYAASGVWKAVRSLPSDAARYANRMGLQANAVTGY